MARPVGTVVFNVSGTRFEIARETIMQHPGSLLALMVQNAQRDPPGELFVDQDAEHFREVLGVYRDPASSVARDAVYLLRRHDVKKRSFGLRWLEDDAFDRDVGAVFDAIFALPGLTERPLIQIWAVDEFEAISTAHLAKVDAAVLAVAALICQTKLFTQIQRSEAARERFERILATRHDVGCEAAVVKFQRPFTDLRCDVPYQCLLSGRREALLITLRKYV